MLHFSDASEPGQGIDPGRIDHLLGEPHGWRFPRLACLAAASTALVVVAAVLLAGRAAAGSATLAPPFLSGQPCVLVLATVPLALLALALRTGRGRAARAR
jgi:hypothetical protein